MATSTMVLYGSRREPTSSWNSSGASVCGLFRRLLVPLTLIDSIGLRWSSIKPHNMAGAGTDYSEASTEKLWLTRLAAP